jgi:chemotaxis protein MotB
VIRRGHAVSHVNHERWLISYADFITLLFALFVVMFASSQPDKHKARQVASSVTQALENGTNPARPPAIQPELAPSKKSLDKSIAPELQSGAIEMHLDQRGLVISLSQSAYFPSGGDAIALSGMPALEAIAATIRDLPNPVRFEGHTDSVPMNPNNPRFASNWDLSAARSIAMLNLFTREYAIPATRFEVAGYADTRPIDTNDTPEGRARNRRVDIVVLNR